MNIIMTMLLFQWFEAIIGKFVALPYQYGLILIAEPAKTYTSWWSTKPDEMITINNFDSIAPLYISGFFIWHYLCTSVAGCVTFGMERCFATFYIDDYESKSRKYISIILLIGTHFSTIPFSYLFLSNNLGVVPSCIASILNVLAVLIIFLFLRCMNNHLLAKMKNPARNKLYSLGMQFQVKENIRCLRMVRKMVFVVVVFITTLTALLILLFLDIIPSYFESYVGNAMENCLFLNPLLICNGLMLSVPSWRNHFAKKFPLIHRLSYFSTTPHKTIVKTIPESEVYFNQLKHAWKI